jgi:hypothetical protein
VNAQNVIGNGLYESLGGSLVRRFARGIAVVFVLGLILITYFEQHKSTNIEDAFREANVPFDSILFSTDDKDRTVTFYKFQDKVSFGVLKDGVLGWKWLEAGSSTELLSEHDISWKITNRLVKPEKNNGVYLFWGTVKNPDIKTVQLELGSGQKVTAGLEREGNIAIVYWLFDKMEDENPFPNVIGFSEDGDKVYQYR